MCQGMHRMSFQKKTTKYHYICLSIILCAVVISSVTSVNTTQQTTTNDTSGLTTTSEMTTQSTLSTSEATSTDSSTVTTTSGNNDSTTESATSESTSMTSTETSTTTDISSSSVTTVSTTNNITTTTGTDTTPETTTDQNTTDTTTVSTTTVVNNSSVDDTDEMTTTTVEPESTTATNGTDNTIATTQSSSVFTSEPNVTTTETPDTTSEQGSNVTDATTGMEPNTMSTLLTETTDKTTRTTPIFIIIQNITTEFTSMETQQTPSTTVTTTTTQTTTKAYQVQPIYPNTENAVLEFTFELRFTDCAFNKTTIENKLSAVSNTVDGCKFIRVKSIKGCESGRRKRATLSPLSVDTVFGIDAQTGATSGSNVSDGLYFTLSTVPSIDVAYLNETKNKLTDAMTSRKICDADVCRNAVIGRPGFVCVSESFMNNTQRCKILYYCDYKPLECGNNGICYVETDMRPGNVSYASKCRCAKESYFRYEGTYCTEKVMTWELAVIICISASGGLILILFFIIIILCCRNASNSADVSFEESELMHTPSGVANTNQYKNGRNSGEPLKGVENRGYMEVRETADSGSWKPEDSANTYASIESKLRESNYNIQIKRPQVSQYKKSDEVTEF